MRVFSSRIRALLRPAGTGMWPPLWPNMALRGEIAHILDDGFSAWPLFPHTALALSQHPCTIPEEGFTFSLGCFLIRLSTLRWLRYHNRSLPPQARSRPETLLHGRKLRLKLKFLAGAQRQRTLSSETLAVAMSSIWCWSQGTRKLFSEDPRSVWPCFSSHLRWHLFLSWSPSQLSDLS